MTQEYEQLKSLYSALTVSVNFVALVVLVWVQEVLTWEWILNKSSMLNRLSDIIHQIRLAKATLALRADMAELIEAEKGCRFRSHRLCREWAL